MSKNSSHPGSPIPPGSPTEIEFGGTPIDASFGDRIGTPPDRPLPDRPPFNSRAVPSQRSRSSTAVQQPEPAPRIHEEKMDKYAMQAGENIYDSDGEADDEFERSDVGVVSPTLPTHFDDNESDHPSESEEEHGSLDGEDTPTTQGWTDREGRSPTGKITQWSVEQVADFIISLSPSLKQYAQTFMEEIVDGLALRSLHHDELRELGVSSVGHRLTILKAVYEQKVRSGVKIEEGDYVPLSAEGDKADMQATQDDIARVIEAIKQRDQRLMQAEVELRQLKSDLDRITDENKKLRQETLPILRVMKDQSTPLPDPAGGTIPSPRDVETAKSAEPQASKGSSLSRKFSTKKLFLGTGPKQPSPTHPPQSHTPQPREVRDDGGAHLEASAAAVAASSHLTASMTSQTSPNSIHQQQLSPTSPAYSTQAPSSGGSYHHPGTAQRSFPRDGRPAGHDQRGHGHATEDSSTGYSTNSQWSQASTVVADQPPASRGGDRRRQAPTPSPREDDGASTRERDRFVYTSTGDMV